MTLPRRTNDERRFAFSLRAARNDLAGFVVVISHRPSPVASSRILQDYFGWSISMAEPSAKES